MRFVQAGTRVRLKVPTIYCVRGVGTLMQDACGDTLTRVMFEAGPVFCLSNEIVVLRDQTPSPVPMRHRLPYGKWTCADGREVLFNRDYEPMWHRRPGDAPSAADPEEWVLFDHEEWFYDDTTAPWSRRTSVAKATIKRCEAVLRDWGITP